MAWSVKEFARTEALPGGYWYGIVVVTNAETNEEEGLRLKFPSEPTEAEALEAAAAVCVNRNEEVVDG